MTWWVYQHQQPVVITSVDQETRFPGSTDCLRKQSIQSACGLPLKTVHRRLGCLVCGSKHPNAFSKEEICFLSLVADQVALAVDDALNFKASQVASVELQRERDRFKLVLDLSNSLVSNLELRDLLRAISANVRRVMKCDAVGVTLPDSESNQLRLYALDFPESKGAGLAEGLTLTQNLPPARVFGTGEPLSLNRGPAGRVGGPKGAAARLGLKRTTLISRMKKLGIDPAELS